MSQIVSIISLANAVVHVIISRNFENLTQWSFCICTYTRLLFRLRAPAFTGWVREPTLFCVWVQGGCGLSLLWGGAGVGWTCCGCGLGVGWEIPCGGKWMLSQSKWT